MDKPPFSSLDLRFMRLALRLARRGYGRTSPNPMVGAVLAKAGQVIGRGWHRRAGEPHAEIEALRDAGRKGGSVRGATLYVTLEPCSTHGRTPPCTEALIASRIKRVVVGATDPNPLHAGRGFALLRRAGVELSSGLLAVESARLNESFHHWIVHRKPFVTVKAAMTLDGKIATESGESKWITGEKARDWGMKLRQGSDAILVGVRTVLADNPSLTFRPPRSQNLKKATPRLRRIILDSAARTPPESCVVRDESAAVTTIVTTRRAPRRRVLELSKHVQVWLAPEENGRISLPWLLQKLGAEGVTALLVEGGGEVNAAFLLGRLAHRVVFFYAPKILGGRHSIKAVGGKGARSLAESIALRELEWRRLGPDLMLTARVAGP